MRHFRNHRVRSSSSLPPNPLPALGRVMGIVPLGIGVTVLGFLWGMPFGEFGSPPLFFRLFGSFIALAFVLTGLGIVFGSAAFAQSHSPPRYPAPQFDISPPDDRPPGTRFVCPKCGAPLAEKVDVSPHGDAKCSYCNSWFNIHGQ